MKRALNHPGPIERVASALQRGDRRAVDIVTASIELLETANARLNVIAQPLYDAALANARDLDDRGHPGPLAGVPTMVKDLEDVAGHPTRQGSRLLCDAPAARITSVTPQRLARAGAVVVAKSTLPEFAIEGYTANDLTGVTRNPWNLDLSPGGSSGGSAAALAAGAVGIATATDGGGSVRIPAALCGLVGLKPTNGLIGRFPEPDWIDYSTDGVFSTSARDLALLTSIVAGPVAGDPSGAPRDAWRSRSSRGPLTLVAAQRTSPWGPLDHSVERALDEAVDALADLLGAPVTWRDPASFFPTGDPDLDWYVTCAAEHVHKLGREVVEDNWDLLHVATREFFSTGLAVTTEQYLAARRRRFGYARVLDELLSEDALLVTPVVTSQGWAADGADENGEVHGLHPRHLATVIQNITGLPALSVPMGTLASGLPFGLQVTAPRYHDRQLLDLALAIEDAYPWPRVAPGYQELPDALGLD